MGSTPLSSPVPSDQLNKKAWGGFGVFAVLLDERFGQAALSGDLCDELPVVAGNAETLGDPLADGAAAAPDFAADGDDACIH